MDFTIENGILLKCTGDEEEVIIPDGVTQIGSWRDQDVFKGCPNMKRIVFPHGLKHIEDSELENYGNNLEFLFHSWDDWFAIISWPGTMFGMSDIRYGKKIYIGDKVLSKELVIPDGIETLKNICFRGCTGFTSVKFPESMVEIGRSAFDTCEGLVEINIPNNVKSIGPTAFLNCKNLETVKLPDGLTEIQDGTFKGCIKLKSIMMPVGLKKISTRAFEECSSLVSITIPETVQELGAYAFKDCVKLEEITYSPDTVKFIKNDRRYDENPFTGCSNLRKYNIPGSIKTEKKISTKFMNIRPRLDEEELAYIGLYQGDKKWVEWFCEQMDQGGKERINKVAQKMAEALGNNGKISKPVQDRVADFVTKYQKKLEPGTVQALQSCFGGADTIIEKAPKKEPKQLSTSEFMQKEKKRMLNWMENRNILPNSIMKLGADAATAEAIMFVLYEYGRQMSKDPVYHAKTYKKDIVPTSICKEADEIAKTINMKLLMAAINLRQPVFEVHQYEQRDPIIIPLVNSFKKLDNYDSYELYIIGALNLDFLMPICRYTNSKTVKQLITNAEYLMKKMSMQGRRTAIAIRSGLLLSDTKEAIAYLDKYGHLGLYAEIRGKTEKEIRALITSDTGLKSDGSMTFDL